MSPRVTVVDYGMGNLFSVRRALEHCGAAVTLSDRHEDVSAAGRLVLPGVGAFADGMLGLRQRGLVEPIKRFAALGRPLLGICLGMQMLLSRSEEFGEHEGLDIIPGTVVAISPTCTDGQLRKIPHIGWNALIWPEGRQSWQRTPLQEVTPGEYVYFVHSFVARPTDPGHRIADCLYGGTPISAAIGRENVFGCQFHPEKSGGVGLKVLKSFLAR